MKLTPWFKARVKPVRQGVYEIRFPNEKFSNKPPAYAFWNGECWGWASGTPKLAVANRSPTSAAIQKKEWRGIAQEPKQ